jgi:hypothetical protein
MSESVTTKKQPAPRASVLARPRARTPDAVTSPAPEGSAHRLPIEASPVATARALLAKPAVIEEEQPSAAIPAAAPASRTNELVFVDSSTPHYESVIEDMRSAAAGGRRLEFVLIDPWRDGVHKITETLVQKKDLDAIHIVPHTRDGAFQLGSAQLDSDILGKRAPQITAWCDALNAQGDILLYGSELAASREGKALLAALSRLTGADPAASESPAGAEAQDGDWRFEFRPVTIEEEGSPTTGERQRGSAASPTAASRSRAS